MDIDEQLGEEILMARSGRVLSLGASVPLKLSCITLPIQKSVHSLNLEAFQTAYLLRFYVGLIT